METILNFMGLDINKKKAKKPEPTTHTCSNCQYFLALGDSKICNALHSASENVGVGNECGDWLEINDVDAAQRNAELQSQVRKEEAPSQWERRCQRLEANTSLIQSIEDRRRSQPYYPGKVTLTELQYALFFLYPAEECLEGERAGIGLSDFSTIGVESCTYKTVVFMVKQYRGNDCTVWKAWEYTGNLGNPIME